MKQITLTITDELLLSLNTYAKLNGITTDAAISRSLHKLLKVKLPALSHFVKYQYPEKTVCEVFYITPEVVKVAVERMKNIESLNLSNEEEFVLYREIDKLAKF